MRKAGHTLLVVALVVAAVAVVPGGAMAADALAVSGEQTTDGTVTVTVTENGSAVANASVTVEALNNSTYAGSGDYVTDENGTVGLPAPEQNVSVSVTASANNATASTTLDLVAPTEETNETEENETEENDSEGLDPFGAQVSSFVASLQDEGNMSGQTVAAFVVGNNPGADERPDHVDPGPKDDDDENGEAGENDGKANGNSGNDNGNGSSDNGNSENGNSGGNNGNGSENDGGNGNGPP